MPEVRESRKPDLHKKKTYIAEAQDKMYLRHMSSEKSNLHEKKILHSEGIGQNMPKALESGKQTYVRRNPP